MNRFCVRCGREEAPGLPLIEGLCVECYASIKKLVEVPETIDVVRCSVCGAIRVFGGRFASVKPEDYLKAVVENYIAKGKVVKEVSEVRVEGVLMREGEALVRLSGNVGRIRVEQTLLIKLSVRKVVCPLCLKYKTRSFEAVVQLRAGNSRAMRIIAELRSRFREHPGVIDVKDHENGVDLLVIDKSIAARIVKDVEARYTSRISTTWEGSKYARKKPKAVFSVRIYQITEGDLVELQGGIYEVVEVRQQSIVLRSLRSEEIVSFSLSEFMKRDPIFIEESP